MTFFFYFHSKAKSFQKAALCQQNIFRLFIPHAVAESMACTCQQHAGHQCVGFSEGVATKPVILRLKRSRDGRGENEEGGGEPLFEA